MIDWNAAPEWARYVAMDKSGLWAWFSHEPDPNEISGTWVDVYGKYEDFHAEFFTGDWAESLQRRPRPVKFGEGAGHD
jgi:hypothetical protein